MWGTVVVGLTNVLATFIAIGLVDRWGRKPTLTLGFLVMAAGMGVLGTMMHIGIHSPSAQIFRHRHAADVYCRFCHECRSADLGTVLPKFSRWKAAILASPAPLPPIGLPT
ncbi:MFS transporter [Enterobacter hormaechei]